MSARRWADAAGHYEAVVAADPGNVAIWIQFGHAVKEMGDAARAAECYANAIAADPANIDALLHHAYLMHRQGFQTEAIDGFAAIVELDPGHHEALTMLVQCGGRHRLPHKFQRAATAADLSILQEQLTGLGHRVERWIDVSTYPLTNYNGFRRDYPVLPPPPMTSSGDFAPPSIEIEIDAHGAVPYYLRATLISLLDLADTGWSAVVRADDALAAHPVASLAADPRIRFGGAASGASHVLHLSAGTLLDPQALTWFKFALTRTGAAALWCDSDQATEHWRDRRRYEQPIFWGVFDLDLMAQTDAPPPAILTARAQSVPAGKAAEARRTMLIEASRTGPVAHIPRLLATVLHAPEALRGAPEADMLDRARQSYPVPGPVAGAGIALQARGNSPCVSVAATSDTTARIHVVIPTRDAAAMLEKACSTLLDMAASPDRITITIVDNRSTEAETAALLARLGAAPNIRVMPFDEPFNWSRANNVGMKGVEADILLFANNDIEMLTPGWDDLLAGYLGRDDIGAVGARLLYPDLSLQHGGILFGLGEGPPIHDGARVADGLGGPQDRYLLTHAAAAVTGAFLAARSDVVRAVGGFDEARLAIAYNDVDFCLKLRAAGYRILYTPAIELIHHESKTRGVADVAVKVAWDLGELRTLYQRWGDSLLSDPGYNPHWSADLPYDGYRNPSLLQILEHIDLSARPNPWALPSPVLTTGE